MTSLCRTTAAAAVAVAILLYVAASVSAVKVQKIGGSQRQGSKCQDLFHRCVEGFGLPACRQCQNVCDKDDAYLCAVYEPLIVCGEMEDKCHYDVHYCYPCATTCERASDEVPDRSYAPQLAATAHACRHLAQKH